MQRVNRMWVVWMHRTCHSGILACQVVCKKPLQNELPSSPPTLLSAEQRSKEIFSYHFERLHYRLHYRLGACQSARLNFHEHAFRQAACTSSGSQERHLCPKVKQR